MENHKVLLMCQGHGWRWNDTLPKQLAPVGGQPLILRTLHQLRRLGVRDIILVGWPEFEARVDCRVYTQPGHIGLLVHGLKQTWHLWSDKARTIVLLGDVVFSWDALETILSETASIRFYGRTKRNRVTKSPHAELYGFSFLPGEIPELRYKIQYLLDFPRCRRNLWTLYRRVIEVDHRKHQTEKVILEYIDDYTDDLDSIGEYNRVRPILDREVHLDDKAHQ